MCLLQCAVLADDDAYRYICMYLYIYITYRKVVVFVFMSAFLKMHLFAQFGILLFFTGRNKCREEWPDETLEKTYTVFLDIILLVLPLFILAVKYGLITRTLWPAATHNDPTVTGTFLYALYTELFF